MAVVVDDDETGETATAITRRWLAMFAEENAASANPNWAAASATNLANDAYLGDTFSQQLLRGGAGDGAGQHHQRLGQLLPAQLNDPSGQIAAPGGSTGAPLTLPIPLPSSASSLFLADSVDASSTWSLLIAALFYKSETFDTNWMNVLSATAIIVLFSATVIGNSFVIMAILIERNLRTIGNYLVLSLAIADLLVALLVMPMAGIYQILDRWTLGVTYCEIWTSADVFCCTGKLS